MRDREDVRKRLRSSLPCKFRVPIDSDEHVTDLDYDPVIFLRCHSKKNDSSDIQTQVWQCAFEPDVCDKTKTTSLVASCGGNSVCFTNVESASVKLKYNAKDLREKLYALAWTVTEGPNPHTLLVAGGTRYTLHFIIPANALSIYNKSLKGKSKNHINSLLFHPKHWNLILCGANNGEIHICNIGNPDYPDFDVDVTIVQSFCANSEVFSLSFCSTNNMLLAGCDGGLLGWKFPDKIQDTQAEIPLTSYKFSLPTPNGGTKQDLVDSVEVIGGGTVATKCALHGAIYLWSLSDTLARPADAADKLTPILPTHVLRWSTTDNYFMFIGVQAEAGLMCCGDDKGQLWLYDLRLLEIGNECGGGGNTKGHRPVEPAIVLPWPATTDPNAEKKRKLAVNTYDIVVDKVALSSDRRHIVAVTNNNMVCVWRRVERGQNDDEDMSFD